MNEAETRAELIDPALKTAGWGVIEGSRVPREVIAPGRLIGNGKRASSEFADYVLVYRGEKLAVIEAKKRDLYRFRLHRNDLTTEGAENAEGENTEVNNSDATGFDIT